MKTVDAGQFAANPEQCLRDSQSETVVVTQLGKPYAVLQGLGYDAEQMDLINSSEFWSMIEERRQRPTIPWADAKAALKDLDD